MYARFEMLLVVVNTFHIKSAFIRRSLSTRVYFFFLRPIALYRKIHHSTVEKLTLVIRVNDTTMGFSVIINLVLLYNILHICYFTRGGKKSCGCRLIMRGESDVRKCSIE